MGNWNDLMNEVREAGGVHDVVRRKYLRQLHEYTGRNVIVYYSGWLQKSSVQGIPFSTFAVNDSDKNGMMATIHQLDRAKGLDLVLHTPGGSTAATESLVQYLRSMFGADVRAVVPQIALSAGTMIALSAREILMGKHSDLGPVDPQIGGVPAHGIIEEFDRARQEVMAQPVLAHIWQPIIAKYGPTLVGEAQKAIDWSVDMVKDWLISGMFEGDPAGAAKADKIVSELASHALTKSHDRHISADRAAALGIKIAELEEDADLQDAVLSVHHACIQTLSATPATKIIENHLGVAYIDAVSGLAVAPLA